MLAANTANAIIASIFWSKIILGEKLIWQYDLTAFVFISTGCITIALNANTQETKYSDEDIKELLKAPRTIVFFAVTIFLIILCLSMMKLVLSRLRRFEKDVDIYQEGLDNENQGLFTKEMTILSGRDIQQ